MLVYITDTLMVFSVYSHVEDPCRFPNEQMRTMGVFTAKLSAALRTPACYVSTHSILRSAMLQHVSQSPVSRVRNICFPVFLARLVVVYRGMTLWKVQRFEYCNFCLFCLHCMISCHRFREAKLTSLAFVFVHCPLFRFIVLSKNKFANRALSLFEGKYVMVCVSVSYFCL